MTDVVVLVDPADDAAVVTRELEARRTDAGSRVLQAPDCFLGARFVTDLAAQTWWQSQRVADDVVLVCRQVPELFSQLAPDMVAVWILWCANQSEADDCAERGHVGVLAADASDLAAQVVTRVLESLGTFRCPPPRAAWGPFARRPAGAAALSQPAPPIDALRAADEPPLPQPPTRGGAERDEFGASPSASAEVPPPQIRWPELSTAAAGPRPLWAGPPLSTPEPPVPTGERAARAPLPPPLAVLSRATSEGRRAAAGAERRDNGNAPAAGFLAWVVSALRREGPGVGDRLGELGARLEARHNVIVGMATSKGGVLKTTHTAGLGLVAETALAPRGGAVAVVEANPDNADLAIDLAIPATAPSVRELIACLESGRETPRAHVVAGTRLEVWPEARQSAGHGSAQIARLHDYLAATYSLVIADFNNCLPDVAGGPAPELLHAWARWIDVWIVPADCSQKALVAAAESIDALTACTRGSARSAAFVLPLLVNDPGARRDRRHRDLVDDFRRRGVAVVEVPHVPRVGRAAMNQWRLTDVHKGLTRAWVALLEEAVAAAEERLAC